MLEENAGKQIYKPDGEHLSRIQQAAKQEKERSEKQGHGEDGTYILVETDQETGDQTVVCHPNDNNQILRFVHPKMAEAWVKTWGEQGYGYNLFKVVDGFTGTNSKAELEAKKQAAEKGFDPKDTTTIAAGGKAQDNVPPTGLPKQEEQTGLPTAEEYAEHQREVEAHVQGEPFFPRLGISHRPLTSSNLKSCAYSPEKKILELQFKNGGMYQYQGVPQEVYDGLVTAESQGGYFHHKIKGAGYEFVKLA